MSAELSRRYAEQFSVRGTSPLASGLPTSPRRGKAPKVVWATIGILVAAVVVWGIALALRPPPTPGGFASGVDEINKIFYDDNGLRVTLVSIEVSKDGQLTAHLRYTDTGPSEVQTTCVGYTDAQAGTITFEDGTALDSFQTYCSQHPDETQTTSAGGSFDSYAEFSSPSRTGTFTFTWTQGALEGSVNDIQLPES